MVNNDVKTSYIKHIVYPDGTVAVVDATLEFEQFKRQIQELGHHANEEDDEDILTREQVSKLFSVKVTTINTWICKKNESKLKEGVHYQRISAKRVKFLKKPIYEKLGIK